jgi:hypothetical protein
MQLMRSGWMTVLILGAALVGSSRAADIGVVGLKLVVVDKLAAADKAKAVFVSKDKTSGITKGPGTNVETIDVAFDFAYEGEHAATAGRFVLPPGASDGPAGWLVNKDSVAKYVNKDAPAGVTGVKVAVVKPGKLL